MSVNKDRAVSVNKDRPIVGHDIRPGDVLEYPYGIRREIDVITVHDVHTYPTGDISIRYSFTSNPHGIDWSGFIDRDDPDVRVISRGVAAVRTTIRSLLQGD